MVPKGPPAPPGAFIAGDGNAVPFYFTHEDSLKIQQQVEFGGRDNQMRELRMSGLWSSKWGLIELKEIDKSGWPFMTAVITKRKE